MAVCEIWDVRGRLDHPIDYAENPEKTANPKYTEADLQAMVDVMEYATNKNKTEQRFFSMAKSSVISLFLCISLKAKNDTPAIMTINAAITIISFLFFSIVFFRLLQKYNILLNAYTVFSFF